MNKFAFAAWRSSMRYAMGLLFVGLLICSPAISLAAVEAKDGVRRLEMSEAITMSENTGRPILAVAGQET